jgi:sugar/nucleoside kinase (ribokinase family)
MPKENSTRHSFHAIAAGHICIDVIPTFEERKGGLQEILVPGRLLEVGPAVTSTGGSVSNTGLALHRLGVITGLMGKIGNDLFGRAILSILNAYHPLLAEGMIISSGEQTSYSIVISPPGTDRIFLHAPGTNNTYGADDVDVSRLEGARLFHFGYPPLMRRLYSDGGDQLARLFERVKTRGLVTSLDMAKPDPESDAGKADWPGLLAKVLPHVDIFLPSFDETLFMLDRPLYEKMEREAMPGGLFEQVTGDLLASLTAQLLKMGAAVAGLKLGDQGLYVRTTDQLERLTLLTGTPAAWAGRELMAPCFQVQEVGTTGAGDCTIAGFLAGTLFGQSLEQVLISAVAVGACNVEAADATSGVPSWPAVQQRISSGWQRRPISLKLEADWTWADDLGLWRGPRDKLPR